METKGRKFIVVRKGPRTLQFCYVLVPAARIISRLRMAQTVKDAAVRTFAGAFRQRMIEAMSGAK